MEEVCLFSKLGVYPIHAIQILWSFERLHFLGIQVRTLCFGDGQSQYFHFWIMKKGEYWFSQLIFRINFIIKYN